MLNASGRRDCAFAIVETQQLSQKSQIVNRSITRLVALLLSCAPAVAVAQVSVSTGMDFSSGKYGEPDKTDTLTIPFILKYETGPWTVKLNLPWTRVKGTVNRDTGEFFGGATRTSQTQSGIGDLTSSAFYTVLDPTTSAVGLDLGGKIKFATASKDKCLLTTGETDYSLQADLYGMIGNFTPFLTLGWTRKGDPVRRDADCASLGEKVDFKNPWYAGAGLSYKLSGATSAGVSYDFRDKLTPSGDPISEATLFLSQRLSQNIKMQVYGVAGFSDNSPDWGLGATVSYSF